MSEMNTSKDSTSIDLEPSVETPRSEKETAKVVDLKSSVSQSVGAGPSSELPDDIEGKLREMKSFVSREPDSFGATPEKVREIRDASIKVISDRDRQMFMDTMDRLDPARDALNGSIRAFEEQIEKLGISSILKNRSLSQEEKTSRINDIKERNPDFKKVQERLEGHYASYHMLIDHARHMIAAYDGRSSEMPDYMKENRKSIEEHPDGVQPLTPHVSTLADAIQNSIRAISEKIKRVFQRIFSRGDMESQKTSSIRNDMS